MLSVGVIMSKLFAVIEKYALCKEKLSNTKVYATCLQKKELYNSRKAFIHIIHVLYQKL